VTCAKNVMTSYGVGDPLEHLRNELLEVLGKAEEFIEIIFHPRLFLKKAARHSESPLE